MSYVCDTILRYSFDDEERDILTRVNSFFEDQKGFVALDSDQLPDAARYWYGGSKVFQTRIAVGVFNYLDLPGLVAHLKAIRWEVPEEAQLIWNNEDDDLFKTMIIFDNYSHEDCDEI